nr:ABC transporter permease subunit [Paenibacillus luteus]
MLGPLTAAIHKSERARKIVKRPMLYLMLLPGIAYFIVFKYFPMWGLLMAFKNYQPYLGVWKSEWAGFTHFHRFFTEDTFWVLFKNTFLLAVYDIIIFFPLTIVLSLLLNEVVKQRVKNTIQSIIYIPHFLSWVVIVGVFHIFFASDGLVTDMITQASGTKIPFLTSPDWFRPLIVIQVIWKEIGWGTIIFLAALSGVNPQLYEAGRMDGANRWKLLWHITLPSIRSVIVILFILRLGNFLDTGFEQIFLMANALNREVADVFDTYVYRTGLTQGQFSYSAAVGLFKSAVGLILVLGANWTAKKLGEEGLY